MKIEEIIRKNSSELFKKRGVVLVVPGTKIKGGVDTGKKALVANRYSNIKKVHGLD